MGTTTIEAKLAKQLAWMEQEPLYQVFVDLRKAYDHLDHKCCLVIMTGYGVGLKLLCLQAKSGIRLSWSVAPEVVLGNCLRPYGASLKEVHYLASYSMFVLVQ
jgi:hypothetical protein